MSPFGCMATNERSKRARRSLTGGRDRYGNEIFVESLHGSCSTRSAFWVIPRKCSDSLYACLRCRQPIQGTSKNPMCQHNAIKASRVVRSPLTSSHSHQACSPSPNPEVSVEYCHRGLAWNARGLPSHGDGCMNLSLRSLRSRTAQHHVTLHIIFSIFDHHRRRVNTDESNTTRCESFR